MSDGPEVTQAPSPLKRALAAIERLQAQLAESRGARHEPVAIVGMGCRYPGGAEGPDRFWERLRAGFDAVGEVPPDRWSREDFYDPDPEASGKIYSHEGAFLPNVGDFDARLFGITPREAAEMDPQQRLLLEVVWEAFEHAGVPADRLAGSRTGVFAGIVNGDYGHLSLSRGADSLGPYYASGVSHSIASGRISYVLGLHGPSLSIDTACSSSLVAVHLAVQSLRNRECDLAVAGGSNAILIPETSVALAKYGMLAADGRCKTFDAHADGYVRGEGCGVVVLKRLSDAADDRVLGVIRGSAVNQDGASSGLTAPNGPSQEDVIRAALDDAGIAPGDVTYVEAHGTGTPLGDPIEIQALARVLGAARPADRPVLVGSVKTNIGHLESAAGVAGLMKAVLSLRAGEIPPHLHLEEPNPHIPWDRLPVSVPTTRMPWPPGAPRIAGVSSFGFSGTNVHMLVEAPPGTTPDESSARRTAAGPDRPQHVLALSALEDRPLRELALRVADRLGSGDDAGFADVAFSANVGRAALPERLAVKAPSGVEAADRLRRFADGESVEGLVSGRVPRGDPPKIGFLFTGQGSQYPGMGRGLYETQPVFRETLERCDRVLRSELDVALIELLYGSSHRASDLLHRTEYTQPALFAIEYSLAEMWRDWGVEPDWVMGHSVGEYVAACVAGVFSMEDGLRLIVERGRLIGALPAGGSMASVRASEKDVRATLGSGGDAAEIAAMNGPVSTVISGEGSAVERAIRELREAGFDARPLKVSHAFHSALMVPVLDRFEEAVAGVELHAPRIRMVSNLSGGPVDPDAVVRPAYWRRHVREPVRFAEGVAALHERGVRLFVEAGPHPILLALAQGVPGLEDAGFVPSLRRERDDWDIVLDGVSAVHLAGHDLDWEAFDRPYGRKRVDLPTYPFQRERYWLSPGKPRARDREMGPTIHPLLGSRIRSPLQEVQFEVSMRAEDFPFVDEHRVHGTILAPASAFLEMGRAAAEAVGSGSDGTILRSVVMLEPLVFEAEGPRVVQTVVDSQGGFRVLSFDGDGERWRLHVEGEFGPAELDVGGPSQEEVAGEIGEIRSRCRDSVPVGEHYDALHAAGYELGPAMRGLQELHRRDGESLARVALPGTLRDGAGDYVVHPALLDGCFQALGAAIPAGDREERAYLPLGVERIVISGAVPDDVWSHVVCHPAGTGRGETLVADMKVSTPEGRVVIEVEGLTLRAVDESLLGARDPYADWLYEISWEPLDQPAESMPEPAREASIVGADPPELVRGLESVLEQHVEVHALAGYQDLFPDLEALSTRYVYAALLELGWDHAPGERLTLDGVISELSIRPRFRRLTRRFLGILEEDGVIEAVTSARRQSDSGPEGGSQPEEWRLREPLSLSRRELEPDALVDRHPPTEPQVRVTQRCGEQLAEVLSGRQDPLAVLFPGGSTQVLERLYVESPQARVFNGVVSEGVAKLVGSLRDDRTLRILEIGAGTGGTTTAVLPVLPPQHCEYTFTDVSPAFLARARERFGSFGFVEFDTLDIEKEPGPQGFDDGSYDLIIAANVLHVTADLAETMRRVSRLLAPGGVAVLVEGSRPERWIDVTFGLTDGWWRFNDPEIRADYPLLAPPRWLELLSRTGFERPAYLPREHHEFGQSVIVARRAASLPTTAERWLLVGDRSEIGSSLEGVLTEHGVDCVFATEDIEDAVRAAGRDPSCPLTHVVHLRATEENGGADDPESSGGSRMAVERRIVGSALETVQALGRGTPGPVKLWFLTRGAQAAGADDRLEPDQAPLWGLAEVVRREHPDLRCVCVDLDPGVEPGPQLAALWEGREAFGREDRIAWRAGEWRVARLVRSLRGPRVRADHPHGVSPARPIGSPVPAPEPDGSLEGRVLAVSPDGVLDGLRWRPTPRTPPGPGEVEIEVRATGLNFRDLMNAVGAREDTDPLGAEWSGTVARVGAGVEEFEEGDEVFALWMGGFATHALAPADYVFHKPAQLDFATAAAQPMAFLTAHYSLDHLGGLDRGERVLIHSAAGGVGSAATRIALSRGAEVFATAGSEVKREYLRSIGVAHVLDSRSLGFADEILEITGGEGVDVVLNSLAGEFIERSVDVLAPRGRFLEIGKTGVLTSEAFAQLRPEGVYHAIDLAAEILADRSRVRPVLESSLELLESGRVQPLPSTVFASDQVSEAFRLMARAGHIGKIVVTSEDAVGAGTPGRIRPDGAYLVTGGLGGLGLLVCEWLAARGAGAVVAMSRRGEEALDDSTRDRLAEWEERGTRIVVESGDVSNGEDVARVMSLFGASLPSLRGVVHSAGVLDDGTLLRQDWDRFRSVMAPKIDGAWALHMHSRAEDLDFIVMFSSVAGILGGQGQGNHAAANAFLDALAHRRRSEGLPALSIGWGVWSDVGAAAAKGATERVAAQGVGAIAPADGIEVFERLLSSGGTQVTVMPMDWEAYFGSLGETPAWLEGLAGGTSAGGGKDRPDTPASARIGSESETGDLLRALRDTTSVVRQRELLEAAVEAQAVKVVGLAPGSPIDPAQPLSELGLDSLMAVELRNHLGAITGSGRRLPATLVFDYPTIEALADYLRQKVLDLASGGGEESGGTDAADATTDVLDDVLGLSDEDLDRYFGDAEGAEKD